MAMIEEACSLSGRNGVKDTNGDNPEEVSHGQLIDDGGDVATIADADLPIGDVPHVSSSVTID